MNNEDRVFFRNFLVVLAVLIVIALLVGVFAGGMSSADREESGLDPRYSETVEQRIKPVGQVAVGEPPKEEVAVVAVAAEPRSGQEIYDGFCAACHGSGLPGVPQLGDTAAWQARWDEGVDKVVADAIKGEGGMPPRGGSDASDDEMRAAVMYLFKQAGLE